MKKLERDALRADLATVEALLAQRTEDEDPIGWMLYNARADDLRGQLADLEQSLDTVGSIALFFGGRPVEGSRGIEAKFGSEVLDTFQTAVSVQHAAQFGSVGTRGPISQQAQSRLLITDLARGSVGFLLEESASPTLVNSHVKLALQQVTQLLHSMASPDEESFEKATEAVDKRVLAHLQTFIRVLYDNGATVRLVEDDHEFSLERAEIERARLRVDSLDINEEEIEAHGLFYFLPDGKRFELHTAEGVLKGTVPAEAEPLVIDEDGRPKDDLLGEPANAKLSKRTISARGRPDRFSYRLLSITPSPKRTIEA